MNENLESLDKNINIEENIQEERRVSAALSRMFDNVYEIDLVNTTFQQIKLESQLDAVFYKSGSAWDLYDLVCASIEPEYRDMIAEFIRPENMVRELAGNNIVSREYKGIRLGWCRLSLIPSEFKDGKLVKLLAVVKKINEEKKQQEEHQNKLVESTKKSLSRKYHEMDTRLSTILSGLNGGLKISKDEPGYRYVYVSEQVAAIQGYTVDEFKEHNGGFAAKNVYWEDSPRIHKEITEQLGTGDEFSLEYRVQCKDGSLKWVRDFGRRAMGPYSAKLIYSLIQDITEQETAKLRAESERKQYREALMHKAFYSLSFDVDEGLLREEVISSTGRNFFKRLGLTAPCSYDLACDLARKSTRLQFCKDGDERIFTCAGLKEMFEENSRYESIVYYLPKFDMYLSDTILLSKDPATGHLIANIIAIDVTERIKEENRQNQRLLDALEEAEKASVAKTIFLNNVSHDIRTPMNAIVGFTNLAIDNLDNPRRVSDYLKKIQSSSNHLLNLINDVLDMSQIESGKVQLHESEICLLDSLREIMAILQADIHRKRLRYVCDVEDLRNRHVICDSLRLNQVLLNILGNAVKFTPEDGTIILKINQSDSDKPGYAKYCFTISDTGLGMSSEFIEHIFESFERERTSTVSKIQGTGLGMSICKAIVEMMGGTIDVSSIPGEGSIFKINIELKVVDKESTCSYEGDDFSVKTEAFSHKLDGLSILLVEDNELNREIAMTLLQERGASVTCLIDGSYVKEEIERVPAHTYDIILMDIQMPVMDGYAATKEVRGLDDMEKANIPIIAMTANAFEEDRKKAESIGMNGHIAKPIDMDVVVKTIHKVLGK
ncbi:MAG: ATP-binding protein [Phascolarctobacterium sp.]|nr:ATP-binding protein [Phascolarctobacterium sp.]